MCRRSFEKCPKWTISRAPTWEKYMIVWTPGFPMAKKPLGYMRLLQARHRYFDRIGLERGGRFGFKFGLKPGYQRAMWGWKNLYKGKPCFILGNGPSLPEMDVSPLRNEITIGSNGVYTKFDEWGFGLNYLLFEDIEQTELRGPDIHEIKDVKKLAGIHNAYAFKADENTTFFNARLGTPQYWESMAPMFSTNFADIVYLGSTVTYIALQLAYFLGCDPVYMIGVDHNYGELPKLFPPGKITVTEENYAMVQKCHFDKNYYKIGNQIGVPNVKLQDEAYTKAREAFEDDGRQVLNAGINSHLDVFERCDFESIFDKKAKEKV